MRRPRHACLGLVGIAATIRADGSALADDGSNDVTVRGNASSSAAGFVSKGSEGDATREVLDVADLIEPLPGVHVRRLGPDDTFSTLSIRGSTSSEVAILFAGVPLTGAADPSLDLASLPLWPGARVKVYRSFTPASVGSGSLGGTLTLEPPRPTDPEGTLAWVGVGSFGAEQMRVADVRAIDDGRGRVVTALSASRATDDFTYYNYAASMAGSPVYATRQNAQHAAVNGLISLALPLDLGRAEPATVTVTTLVEARRQGLPGSITGETLFAELVTNRELLSVDLSQPVAVGAVHVLGWARRDESDMTDSAPPSGYSDLPLSTDDVIAGAGGAFGWSAGSASRSSIALRADGSVERFAPGDDHSPFGADPGATRASVGAGADAEWRPWPRLTLGASGRLDGHVDDVDALPGGPTAAAPLEGGELLPTGHLGAEVVVGPVTLAAHGGALARPPSFVERYGGGGVLPSPTLVSESALTADVGAHLAGKARGFRLHAEVDGFATHADDLITLIPEGAFGLFKATNIASARIFGVESSVDLRGHGLDLRAAYTGLLTFNDDPTVAISPPPPLPGRPGNDFVGDVAYTLGPVRARYGVDYVGSLYVDERGTVPVPDRLLQSVGLRVVVPWVPSLRFAADISNLFDVRTGVPPAVPCSANGVCPLNAPTLMPIGDQFDYPLPGRTFLVTARWSVGVEPLR